MKMVAYGWALALCLLVQSTGAAGELVIASEKQCVYQIVTPDTSADPLIGKALADTANTLRNMFKSNGFTVPVIAEAQADKQKLGIFLGDTAAARAAGVQTAALPVWTYVLKLSGRNVIIAGRDWLPPRQGQQENVHCSLGTVKGVTDFMRQYAGTRFLFPEGPTGIEFLPTPRIAVPDDLNVRKEPMLQYNCGWRASNDINSIGLNLLGNVTTEYFAHTHEIAVPAEKYAATHPEYFALVGGKRIREYQHGWLGMQKEPHLCYSNKDVQELIYKDMLRSLDVGFPEYLSLQADGFTPCECEECRKLFNTDDWGEKLWQLNKRWAERLQKDRPGKVINVTAYTVTGQPPSFKDFPPNMRISVGGYPEAFKIWESCKVPAGFSSYLHAWGWYHLCGYMPVRTPMYCERVVKMFDRYNVRGVGLDAPPAVMWALEGPAVYTYARMLDDPKTGKAQTFLDEYLAAAYGKAVYPMTQFFDVLHHTLEAYAEVFGVDNGTFQTCTRADGQSVRYVTPEGKLRLIAFLYPPETLDLLESHLAQAEAVPGLSDKVRLRLALARREFNYLKSTVRVVHVYHAWQVRKDRPALEQLLNEMEAREKMILAWYDPRREYSPGIYYQQPISPNWRMFLGSEGHYQDHLMRNGGTYLAEPVPPFTWTLAGIRKAALFEPRALAVAKVPAPLTLDAPEWDKVPARKLGPLALGDPDPKVSTTFKLACDGAALYLRFEGDLPEGWLRTREMKRDTPDITWNESFSAVFAPDGNPQRFYRFAAGPNPGAIYDARQGFIEDSIDPRASVDDRSWNADWRYDCAVAPDAESWRALFVIPFASLGAQAPLPGAQWKANFGRHHFLRGGAVAEDSLWSSNPGTTSIGDRAAFGILRFER